MGVEDKVSAEKRDHDDEKVFQLLSEARQQYERYLDVIRSNAALPVAETLNSQPSPDLPLSLTIWRDK